ncbi:MAG: amidohydrolase family protein [Chloroflexota bacterium]
MARFSVVVRGGYLIDPATGRAGRYDVAFNGERVAEVAERVDAAAADYAVDATGCYVIPGIVDLHSHVFDTVGEGSDADQHGLLRGTTTTVDGGSAGWRTIRAFRQTVERKQARALAWLNLSSIGQVDLRVGELLIAHWVDPEGAIQAAREYPDLIVGFKGRLSTYVCGGTCLPVLRALRQAADATGLPVMVHIGDSGEPLGQVLPHLQAGDVVTHTLTPRKHGILGSDGRVIPEAFEARERGVLFDAAHGRNHVGFNVLRAAVEQSFLPDSLATDITQTTAADPTFGMPRMASMLMSFGVPLEIAVAAMTVNPARAIRRPDLGSLAVGASGDATLLRLEEGSFTLRDVDGVPREISQRLVPVGVVRAGVFVSADVV